MASITTSTGSIDDLATQMKDLKLTLKKDEALAYLDINIDETTERYNNCVEFVKTKNLAYGLSSNRLVELIHITPAFILGAISRARLIFSDQILAAKP